MQYATCTLCAVLHALKNESVMKDVGRGGGEKERGGEKGGWGRGGREGGREGVREGSRNCQSGRTSKGTLMEI